jgi:hypothetical protein
VVPIRRIVLVGLIAALVVVTVGLASSRQGSGDAPALLQSPPRSTFDLEQARAISDFPIYYAGQSIEGFPLVAVLRRDDTADYVSFIYGDCVVTSDTGCAPPAEIQAWPACKRNLRLYDATTPGTPIPDAATIRGAPAAFFEDGQRLEIQTDRATVVVFAASKEVALRVANALQGVNVDVSPGMPLPLPVPGAVEGKLPC